MLFVRHISPNNRESNIYVMSTCSRARHKPLVSCLISKLISGPRMDRNLSASAAAQTPEPLVSCLISKLISGPRMDRNLSASAAALHPNAGTPLKRGNGQALDKNGISGKNGQAAPPKTGLVRRTMSFQFGRNRAETIDPVTMKFISHRYKDVAKEMIWPEYREHSLINKAYGNPSSSKEAGKGAAIQYHLAGNHQPVTVRLDDRENVPKDIRKSVLKANAATKAAALKKPKPIDAISMSEEGVHTGSSIFYAHAYDITNAAEMQTHSVATVTKPPAPRKKSKIRGGSNGDVVERPSTSAAEKPTTKDEGDAVSNTSSTSIDPQPHIPPRSVDDYAAGRNPQLIFQADIEDERSPYMPAMINSVRRSESESSSDSVVQITRL
ncbi:hypothetical protein L596_016835 [Steinernema carpocapsae]|uniref:Uncharacterized protein n=1 Tax=Steinernema carpocapsae TaxID=34508 RepID=A0A4U5NKG3_STECR|nr:hypothetical protein L596_016835 [Steinernema carpocapsae]